jgi:hypothetical protein
MMLMQQDWINYSYLKLSSIREKTPVVVTCKENFFVARLFQANGFFPSILFTG